MQRCDSDNTSGVIGLADVTDIAVRCANAYHVTGIVRGLESTPKGVSEELDLRLFTPGDTIGLLASVTTNGPFEFPVPLIPGDPYEIEVVIGLLSE